LNFFEWFLQGIDKHAIAKAHASIRIGITAFLVAVLVGKRLWTLTMPRGKKVYLHLILICSTGVFTTPLMVLRLRFYFTNKEGSLSVALLEYRILEAGLDIVCICLPYILQPFCRRRYPVSSPASSFTTHSVQGSAEAIWGGNNVYSMAMPPSVSSFDD
jgi:Fungal rhodopsin domain